MMDLKFNCLKLAKTPYLKLAKTLDDQELLSKIKTLVADERRVGIEILSNLREIELRRLFAARGFSSLHEYATKELGYSDGAAFRRISAMRLIADLPEAETKIAQGELSLTVASKLQGFFKSVQKNEAQVQRVYTPEQKTVLLNELVGKSSRECEKKLAGLSSRSIPKDRIRAVSETEVEIKFVANDKLQQKINRLKEIMGTQSTAKLFEKALDIALEQMDPQVSAKSAAKQSDCANSKQSALKKSTSAPKLEPNPALKHLSRYIAVQTRLEVWQRDHAQCSYVDPLTKRRCHSKFALQLDHIVPHALGGLNDTTNLRLRCPAHNQLAAIQVFGREKMSQFVPSLK